MQFSWFDTHWPWLGLAASALLWILLLTTNIFRSDVRVSRWRDPVWLAWLAPAGYMLHNVEEYGVDMMGKFFAFPDQACSTFFSQISDCPFPTSLWVAINIPAIWIGGLVCALLARRHPLMGLSLFGVYFVNALSHIGTAVGTGTYNPGLLTAVVVLLPLSLWVAYATVSDTRIGKSGIWILFLVGMALNGLLMITLVAFSRGLISGRFLVAFQLVNPLSYVLLPWLKERRDNRRLDQRSLHKYR